MRRHVVSLFLVWLVGIAPTSAEESITGPLNVYIDADYTTAWQTAQSIEQGIRAAFATQDFQAADYDLQVVPLDHRSNARRSIENLRQFDSDPNGIAVIGGMHSPVYIRHIDEILEREIPLLLAWSASGMLTRQRTGPENWIFRLSVDDHRVGPFLARTMLDHGCERIGLAVLDNSWGMGNLDSITAALSEQSVPRRFETTMATEIGAARASQIAAEMSTADVDCVGMVGNYDNSSALTNAIDELGLDVRLFSHWGILAGDFTDTVPHAVRASLGLTVVQSCGLNLERRDSAMLDTAIANATALGWDYPTLSDVPAPAGFVHGFDLGLILMAAIEQASAQSGWSSDPAARRTLLRATLETLDAPVRGILRTYRQPFSEFSEANIHAHEALSGDDLCLAEFDEQGRLIAHVPVTPIEEAALDR